MHSWHSVLEEARARGSVFDILRRERAAALSNLTGRNVIVYYSGWLQKPGAPFIQVNDADKNGLMAVVHGLDRSKGLDLLLHTPGGEVAATESIVDYLHAMFGTNIRAIVPQLAMSAGTMIACACESILMGKQSSLGPIDPQFRGIPAHGVVEEFRRALQEVKADPSSIPIWQPIIAKYSPTLIGECEKAIDWSSEMVKDWLLRGMFRGVRGARATIDKIVSELADHALTKSHARHISADKCTQLGLRVEMLEADQALQDAVLSLHHTCVHTLAATAAIKIIENQNGVAYIQQLAPMANGPIAGSQGEATPSDAPIPAEPPPAPQQTGQLRKPTTIATGKTARKGKRKG